MRHLSTSLMTVALAMGLGGCLSISSTKSPEAVVVDPCSGKEQSCRDLCGSAGVQSFSCDAKPGEAMHYKCECRKPGQSI